MNDVSYSGAQPAFAHMMNLYTPLGGHIYSVW